MPNSGFGSFASCVSCAFMKFRGFSLDPFNKLLYILVFKQPVYCIVMIKQLSFRKIGVNLPMTDSVEQDNVFAFKCFWYEMVLAWFFRKRPVAKWAELDVIHG